MNIDTFGKQIEKFSLHLLRQPDVHEILSEPEYDYAQK